MQSAHPNRRSFLRTAALGSLGVSLASSLKGQAAKLSRKPNLVVFLADQQRADTLACYGAPRTVAPNLDKLASQSFVFQRAYVTQPVCAPSRSSLMTGTWPHTNGCTRNGLRPEPRFLCLPELLADHDYRTGYMGKWHLGDEFKAQHGFQEWVSIIDGPEAQSSTGRDRDAVSDYYKFLIEHGVDPRQQNKKRKARPVETGLPLELSKPRFLETRACDFLERNRHDPFILFVSFFEPHPPYNGPLNERNLVDGLPADPTSDQIFGEEMPLRYRLRQETDKKKVGGAPQKLLKIKQRYLGLVSEVDQSIGVILTKLEQLGLTDKTIIIHTSDHGDMLGAHGIIGKSVMFEEAVRVPYLVCMPSQQKSISIPQGVSHIDFGPTVIDLLGGRPHDQCAGKSRAPLLRGQSLPVETVFAQWNPGITKHIVGQSRLAPADAIARALQESTRTAIFADGWKICLRDRDKSELYNLQTDPREERNVYNTTDKKIVGRLTDEVHQWQESVADNVKV